MESANSLLVSWSWTTLPSADIPGEPKVGELFDVKLLGRAGLVFNRDRDKEFLFCRDDTLRLWKTLSTWSAPAQDGLSVVGHVRGPPGTGKSTTTFAWLQAQVALTGKSVAWFHVDSNNIVHRMVFKKNRGGGGVSYTRPEKVPIDKIQVHITKCTSTILVLDGVKSFDIFKNSIVPSVRVWAGKEPGARTAVLVSSGAFPEQRPEDAINLEIRNEVFQNWSWTRDDYVRACKRDRPDSNFSDRVRKKSRVAANAISGDVVAVPVADENAVDEALMEDLDDKFFYAGGCARFFFGFSTEDVKKQIVADVDSLRIANNVETRHRLVSLFQSDETDGTRKSLMSQFAVQKLVDHAGEKAFIFLYGLGDSNPSFDGWIFEADFFFQYKRATEMRQGLELGGDPSVMIEPSHCTIFDYGTVVKKAIPLNMCDTNSIADKWKEEVQRELKAMVKSASLKNGIREDTTASMSLLIRRTRTRMRTPTSFGSFR
jgi:hypothetical protein